MTASSLFISLWPTWSSDKTERAHEHCHQFDPVSSEFCLKRLVRTSRRFDNAFALDNLLILFTLQPRVTRRLIGSNLGLSRQPKSRGFLCSSSSFLPSLAASLLLATGGSVQYLFTQTQTVYTDTLLLFENTAGCSLCKGFHGDRACWFVLRHS